MTTALKSENLLRKTPGEAAERLQDCLQLIRRLPGCEMFDIEPAPQKSLRLVRRLMSCGYQPISDPMTLTQLSYFVCGFYSGMCEGWNQKAG